MQILEKQRRNLFPFFLLISLGTQGALVFLMLILVGVGIGIRNKPAPTLVELKDGRGIRVTPIGSKERSPETITRFVSDTLYLMFDWQGTLPAKTRVENTTPQTDPGISIQATQSGKKLIPTNAWQASFAFSEVGGFRASFLQQVAEMVPEGVFQQKEGDGTKVVFVPLHISTPEPIESGKWKVQIVANLIVFRAADRSGTLIPFNKDIFLQAVDAPQPPQETSDLSQAIYQIRQSGIEIYGMRELQRENL
jgi:hypothetical protein